MWHVTSGKGSLSAANQSVHQARRLHCRLFNIFLQIVTDTLSETLTGDSESNAANPPVMLIASISSVAMLLCIAVLVFFLCRRKKNVKEEVVAHGDENPVYGMYYFADGEHIDYGSVEVEDDNAYYGT